MGSVRAASNCASAEGFPPAPWRSASSRARFLIAAPMATELTVAVFAVEADYGSRLIVSEVEFVKNSSILPDNKASK
jgi:hypothetical protein